MTDPGVSCPGMTLPEDTLRRRLLALSLSGVVVGMVFSPVLLSVSIIATGVAGVLGSDKGLNPDWQEHFPRFLRSGLFWGLAGLYFYQLLPLPPVHDWLYFMERLRVKLPLLVLPFAWPGIAFPAAGRGGTAPRDRYLLLAFLGVVVSGVLLYYAAHFREVNAMIYRGQAMPVPRGNHIRFSLLVAIGATAGLDGWFRYRSRWLLIGAAALFVALHVMAVRSGLFTAYAGWLCVAGGWAFRRRNYRVAAIGVAGLVILPVAAYLLLPSFSTKFDYMRYELLHRDPGQNGPEYSDEGRLSSIRLGLEVWRDHPVIGVGPGNLRAVMDSVYAERLPGIPGKRPHNQFVTALAGGGAVGFLVTAACFAALLFGGGRWRDPLFLGVFAILTLSCLVENTLETSVGATLFPFFLLLYGYPPYRKPG